MSVEPSGAMTGSTECRLFREDQVVPLHARQATASFLRNKIKPRASIFSLSCLNLISYLDCCACATDFVMPTVPSSSVAPYSLYEIWDFHGGELSHVDLTGFCAVYCWRYLGYGLDDRRFNSWLG